MCLLMFRSINGQVNSVKTYLYNDFTKVSGIAYFERNTAEESDNSTQDKSNTSTSSSGNSKEDFTGQSKVIEFVRAQLGKPYVWGATGPDSFDCSGLCQAAYATIGFDTSRTTYSMLAIGGYQPYPGDDQLKPGDLLFPHTGHVVMYVGEGKVIHAPQTGDVVKEVDLNYRTYKYWWRPIP